MTTKLFELKEFFIFSAALSLLQVMRMINPGDALVALFVIAFMSIMGLMLLPV